MSERDYKDLEGDVDAIASYWIVRLDADDCTPEDRFACDAWRREDPSHEEAYQRIKRGNEYLDRFMGDPDFQARIELARERTAPQTSKRYLPVWLTAAAACLALTVIGTVFLSNPREPIDPIVLAEPVEAYETRVGERSTITLSDGTNVTINTNSRIEVGYTDSLREITLVRGQGFFDVAKDIDRPFMVVAGDKRVMALGTVFDVRFDDANEVQVTLVEGKVQVDEVVSTDNAERSGVTSTNTGSTFAAIELSPGERLVARADATPVVTETNAVEETSWRRGQLIFRRRALAEVVNEMNRYSAQQMVLDDDERVLALEVSGVFNNGGPPSAFVDALEAMHPLEARRSGADELTLVWRE